MTEEKQIKHVIKLFSERKPIKISSKNLNKVFQYSNTRWTSANQDDDVIIFTPLEDYVVSKTVLDMIRNRDEDELIIAGYEIKREDDIWS